MEMMVLLAQQALKEMQEQMEMMVLLAQRVLKDQLGWEQLIWG